ncbi:MAG: outer membrane beta-barrel protein [Oceanicaulis sp.]
MHTILLASIAAAAVTSAASAQTADGSAYVGVGAGLINVDLEGLGDVTNTALLGTAGYDFSRNLGIETQALIGVTEDEILGVDVKINYAVSAFVVGRLPVGETGSNLFARVGYGTAEAEASGGGATFSDDDSGFAYGVGGEWAFAGPNTLRFDATLLEGNDTTIYGISYIRRF